MNPRLNPVYRTLYWTYGLVPIIAGLDKFTGLLADWQSYLSPSLIALSPLEPPTLMAVIGVIEIAAGVLLLWRPRLGAWIVAGWLLLIALQLVVAGIFDVAVRDLVMATGAFALARLAEVRDHEVLPAAAEAVP